MNRYGYGTYEDPEQRRELPPKLARPDGYATNGTVARDYLDAGRDAKFPRKTTEEIDAAIAKARGAA